MQQTAPEPAQATGADTPRADEYRIPGARAIGFDAPFRWIANGYADLRITRLAGVLYGFVFVLMGLAIALFYETQWELTLGLTAGFFLIGPFACCGVYWLSRQRERGETTDLAASLSCWMANPASIGFFAAALTFLMVIWARVSVVVFALFSTANFPTLQGMVLQIFSFSNLPFVIAWLGTGLVFAAIAFAISVVSIPLMLDRKTDTMMALFCSVRAVWLNPGPMLVWAALIVLLVGASLMLWFVPLLITAPLVGHATWHAYRDLVADDAPASAG